MRQGRLQRTGAIAPRTATDHPAADAQSLSRLPVGRNAGGAIMAEIPWNFRIQPDPGREYFVAVTSGLRISWWNPRRAWAFQRYTLEEPGRCASTQLGGSGRPLKVGGAIHLTYGRFPL